MKTEKPYVVFDLDDTIADFVGPALELTNKVLKKSFSVKDLKNKTFEELYCVESKDLKKMWTKGYLYPNLNLRDPWVKYWFKTAHNLGLNCRIYTARRDYLENAKAATEQWLLFAGLNWDVLKVFDCQGSKADSMNKSCVAYFDDNPKQVEYAISKSINSWLISSPLNSDSALPRLDTVASVQVEIQRCLFR
jgi:hypothetical protein